MGRVEHKYVRRSLQGRTNERGSHRHTRLGSIRVNKWRVLGMHKVYALGIRRITVVAVIYSAVAHYLWYGGGFIYGESGSEGSGGNE